MRLIRIPSATRDDAPRPPLPRCGAGGSRLVIPGDKLLPAAVCTGLRVDALFGIRIRICNGIVLFEGNNSQELKLSAHASKNFDRTL